MRKLRYHGALMGIFALGLEATGVRARACVYSPCSSRIPVSDQTLRLSGIIE